MRVESGAGSGRRSAGEGEEGDCSRTDVGKTVNDEWYRQPHQTGGDSRVVFGWVGCGLELPKGQAHGE